MALVSVLLPLRAVVIGGDDGSGAEPAPSAPASRLVATTTAMPGRLRSGEAAGGAGGAHGFCGGGGSGTVAVADGGAGRRACCRSPAGVGQGNGGVGIGHEPIVRGLPERSLRGRWGSPKDSNLPLTHRSGRGLGRGLRRRGSAGWRRRIVRRLTGSRRR